VSFRARYVIYQSERETSSCEFPGYSCFRIKLTITEKIRLNTIGFMGTSNSPVILQPHLQPKKHMCKEMKLDFDNSPKNLSFFKVIFSQSGRSRKFRLEKH
jgi:hypothetical protein